MGLRSRWHRARSTLRRQLRPGHHPRQPASVFPDDYCHLLVVVAQLTITGLHELSEARILPSSKTEMAIIGPVVKNDILFFITILALAAVMMLMEWRNADSQNRRTRRRRPPQARWSARASVSG